MIIYAVDPGLASGVALLHAPAKGEIEKLGSWEMAVTETEDSTAKIIETYREHDLRVVIERFTVNEQTAKKSAAPWSMELIGSLKYICRINGAREPVLQTPADAKNFAPNPRLKALGLWHRGGHGHALDALRHGLLYACKNGYIDKRLLSD